MNSTVTSGQISRFAILIRRLFSQVSSVISLVYLLGEHEGKLEEGFLQVYEIIFERGYRGDFDICVYGGNIQRKK